jgi:hypothetical protein
MREEGRSKKDEGRRKLLSQLPVNNYQLTVNR